MDLFYFKKSKLDTHRKKTILKILLFLPFFLSSKGKVSYMNSHKASILLRFYFKLLIFVLAYLVYCYIPLVLKFLEKMPSFTKSFCIIMNNIIGNDWYGIIYMISFYLFKLFLCKFNKLGYI